MSTRITSCPIWGIDFKVEGYKDEATRTYHIDNSPRAGGGYILPEVLLNGRIRSLDASSKARLTTWLIDQHLQGNEQPNITEEVVRHIEYKAALPVWERADRLLRHLANITTTVGHFVSVSSDDGSAFAWSESIEWDEVNYLKKYLNDQGCIEVTTTGRDLFKGIVTVHGFAKTAENISAADLSQAFVAMWFGPEMNDAYGQGLAPAIKEAGFNPLRIDHKLDVEKIDDAIIAEIRRSRFLVADFTHGGNGVRGGVYFEAGFAMGLGIPVFYTCRSDMVTKLHFDTRQYAHIVWSNPEDLKFDLRDRILARIGQGPGRDDSVPLSARPGRVPLGQWLVDNMPRGTNLETPPRNDIGRPNLFIDETVQ